MRAWVCEVAGTEKENQLCTSASQRLLGCQMEKTSEGTREIKEVGLSEDH